MKKLHTAFAVIVAGGFLAGGASAAGAAGAQKAQAWVNPFPKAESPGARTDTLQELANKKVVLEFYDKALNAKDFDAASRFLGPEYIQHNPSAADGLEGLKAFIQFLKDEYPSSHSEVKQVITDGDYVILHVHSVRTPGTLGDIVGDIFRLENGKVVEHWDAVQPVPTKPSPKNHNRVF